MKICRTIVAISIAFLLLCGLQGCKKTNKNGVLVTVTSMIPNRGGTGTVVTITGTGFYADTSQETVSVALLNANILSATATQIVFSVPMVKDSATLDSTFVLVTVQDQAVVTAGTFYFDNAGVGGADVSTFAGSGSGGSVNATGTAASFQSTENGVFDQSGNMYVSDELNNRIRMIDPSGTVSTVAGSGTTGYYDAPGTGAQFNRPIGLAYDSVTATLYVADSRNNV